MASVEVPASETVVTHPLEPLTSEEIAAAVGVLRDKRALPETVRFSYVVLHEPDKDALDAFESSGTPVDRCADAVLIDRATGVVSEAVVSLRSRDVVSFVDIPDVQPALLFEDCLEAILAVKEDARWQDAMRHRGITDLDSVQLDPWPAGRFGDDLEDGRRLTRVVSYVRHDTADNGYAHPIEGVLVYYDFHAHEVVQVDDYGITPIPAECSNYDPASLGAPLRTDRRPLEITQPDGPSFTVEGHEVRWQRWRFRVSMHPMHGLVLHALGYEDGGRVRPILHRAALSEMVVPYGHPSPMQAWKNAFDAGEWGLGRMVNSLALGCDCLGVIRYFDAAMTTETGDPYVVEKAICLHEEDYGILWKHVDMHTGNVEVRRRRRLVVSSIHTVGNYEYGFYWYLYEDGMVQHEVKLTGIMQTMAVDPRVDGNGVSSNGDGLRCAEMIAPGLAAPNHQHLFNFRLDFDVDGTTNSVYEVDVEALPTGSDNPLANSFVTKPTLLARESDAQRVVDPARSRTWKIVNPRRTNRLGQPVGYKLVPGSTPTLLASPDSSISRRATFATKNLWVTPFARDEMRAAGEYPNQHAGGAGLPEWTAHDRAIADTDVVVWYTFGVTHIPRPEDWPVMPVEYAGFTLVPVGFFDRNPSLDVAPQEHCAHE
jgi:primary-amine oxidase